MKGKNNQVSPEMITSLEFHTKLSKDQRKSRINWFNKQNIEFQILIFEEQKNQFFKLKNEGTIKEILSLASFLLAIEHFYKKEQLLRSKNKSQTLNELGNIGKIEKVKLKKEKTKQKLQLLLSMHSVIVELYSDGYSSREISKILLMKYKKEISHTYVNNYINEYIIDKEN